MRIQYLGTAASEGWPALFCNCPICREAAARGGRDHRMRSCALVDDDLLLDVSPDIYGAVQKLGVNLSAVRHAAITHGHSDHFNVHQLHWYAPNFNKTPPDGVLRVYGSTPVHRLYDAQRALWGTAFIEGWMEFVEVNPFETVRMDERTLLTALPAVHAREGEGAQTYLLERDGKRILYLHDTARVVDEIYEFLRGRRVDLVSLDATVGPMPQPGEYGHMNFERDISAKRRFIEAGIVDDNTAFIVNHICIHPCYDQAAGKMYFYEDMQKMMDPYGIRVSYDGMTVEF